jgi:arylsulfatase A-like enzyme
MPGPGFNRRSTVIRHVALAATTAFIVGAFDGALSARATGESPLFSGALCAGTLAIAGAFVGLIQAALVVLAEPIVERRGWRTRWNAAMNSDSNGDRAPVVAFHAWLASAISVGAPLVLAFAFLLQRSERIKEVALRDTILIMGAALAIILALILSAIARPAFVGACERIDRSWGLPRPRSRLLRYVLFVAVPASILLAPIFQEFGVKLGILATPFALVWFLVAEGLLWRLAEAIRDKSWLRGRGARALALGSLLGVLTATIAASYALFELWPGAKAATNAARVTSTVAVRLQRFTDVDGDGVSSLFGGEDCAAFDASRSPMNTEIPNNGVDEDCDGRDATAEQVVPTLEPYYGELLDSQKQRFNVILLVIDSLRPDHLSAYGYGRETSPHLNELAEDAWLFTRAYAQSSTTGLSMPSILSGRRPSSMQWKGGYPETVETEWMLPKFLGQHGYKTTLAANRYVVRHMKGLQRDFQEVLSVPAGSDWKSGEHIISNVIGAVERAQREGRPFFIAAHFDDVHHPYRAHIGHSVPDFPHPNQDIAAYDRCIARFDEMLRFLSSSLDRLGTRDDTILIVTADHGEEFEEHGGTIHSRTCYVESVQVPLIVRIPGFRPQRISTRVALTDVVPTLLEAVSLSAEPAVFDGQSLFVPALAPDRAPDDRPIFCSVFQLLSGRKNFFTRSVRTKEHVLIHEALSDHVELYDAVKDPGESRNIAPSNPEIVHDLRELLRGSATGNLWEARRFQ